MEAGRHCVARCAGRLLAGLLCSIVVSACEHKSSAPPRAPESRAEFFVGQFIREPQAVDELRSVARLVEGKIPDTFASDPLTRNALTYLRARQRLGAKFGLSVAGTRRPAADKRVISVVVSEGAAALKEGVVVRFEVELQKEEDAWLVTRLRSD